jgi:hypothetical protein
MPRAAANRLRPAGNRAGGGPRAQHRDAQEPTACLRCAGAGPRGRMDRRKQPAGTSSGDVHPATRPKPSNPQLKWTAGAGAAPSSRARMRRSPSSARPTPSKSQSAQGARSAAMRALSAHQAQFPKVMRSWAESAADSECVVIVLVAHASVYGSYGLDVANGIRNSVLPAAVPVWLLPAASQPICPRSAQAPAWPPAAAHPRVTAPLPVMLLVTWGLPR